MLRSVGFGGRGHERLGSLLGLTFSLAKKMTVAGHVDSFIRGGLKGLLSVGTLCTTVEVYRTAGFNGSGHFVE